ncbi:MAG: saccharopine dehydrogenase NADP-binding domain-containing protein [Actinomycetota bacterium]|nr:saccharopine dehydrogenase NADP-binding domain-containing protein [Actinomycetota bacterium]
MNTGRVQSGPIAVYGATGYTGRLIAAELARSGLDFVLAGRNRAKLEALSEELGIDVPLHAIGTGEAAALRELFSGCSAVIACAGPFYLHGEPVLAAAVEAGTPYLDTTGEQLFIRTALDEYGPRAAANGSAVMSGMGFDYVPGDLLASLTAEGMGELETLRLAYTTKFQPTRGTMLSALEMIKGYDSEWRDGRLVPASPSINRGKFDFGPGTGEKAMTRYPAGEHVTVPRHVNTRRVETMLSADSVTPGPLVPLTPLIMRPAAAAMRTPLKGVISRIVNRLPEGAGPEERAAATWTVGCEAVADGRVRRGSISGKDVYGLTAALLVKGAALAAAGELRGTGGLAPSQAFDPAGFLDDLERFSVKWTVEPLP